MPLIPQNGVSSKFKHPAQRHNRTWTKADFSGVPGFYRSSMNRMAPRTPESLSALIVQFIIAMIFLFATFRFKWRIGGVRHDGVPLGKSGIALVVVCMVAIFFLLATVTVLARRQVGLPAF